MLSGETQFKPPKKYTTVSPVKKKAPLNTGLRFKNVVCYVQYESRWCKNTGIKLCLYWRNKFVNSDLIGLAKNRNIMCMQQ